jgi:hypothetical protein
MNEVTPILLLDDEQVLKSMNIAADDLEFLVATRQLQPIFISHKRRFPFHQLEALIRTYSTVQSRN